LLGLSTVVDFPYNFRCQEFWRGLPMRIADWAA